MAAFFAPFLSASAAFVLVLWLARNLILTRLNASVDHEFAGKLETLRNEFERANEVMRADLRFKEAEITALRSGALAGLAHRQAALDARRIQAVDQLWSTVIDLHRARSILAMMSVVNFDVAARRAEADPKVRQMFGEMGSSFAAGSLDLSGANKAQPFVSIVAWASYTALLTLMLHAAMRLEVLRTGAPAKMAIDDKALLAVLKATLPDQSDFIDKTGPTGFWILSGQIENKLLSDLQAMLAGADADKASVEQAAKIIQASAEVMKGLDAEKSAGRAR